MKSYELRTEYDCLIKHSQGESFLDSNSFLELPNPEKILIYPIDSNKNLFPFSLSLDDDSPSPLFKSFCYKDKKYIFLSSMPIVKNEIIEEIKIDSKTYRVFISPQAITFSTDTLKKSISISNQFDSYLVQEDHGLIMVHLIGIAEDMWFFNTTNNQLFHISGKKIEKIENQVLVSKNTNDIANHEIYETFEIVDNTLTRKSCKLKYNDETPNLVKNDFLIPVAFLDAIKSEDYELAGLYLSDELNQTSTEHLKKYFGKILSILPIEDFVLAIITETSTKILTFEIKNSKIVDIAIE